MFLQWYTFQVLLIKNFILCYKDFKNSLLLFQTGRGGISWETREKDKKVEKEPETDGSGSYCARYKVLTLFPVKCRVCGLTCLVFVCQVLVMSRVCYV